LLVGTGSEGLVYQVNPAAEETVVLAKVDPKQVMSMLAAKDGRIILGMANVGGLATMSSGYAGEGSFTSPVLDATQISRFGKVHLEGSLPSAATLSISTRSGNLQEPGDTGWSKWSEELPATEFVQVPSPAARFLQYRLTFGSKNSESTPVVDEVDVAYQMPNLARRSRRFESPGHPEEMTAMCPQRPRFRHDRRRPPPTPTPPAQPRRSPPPVACAPSPGMPSISTTMPSSTRFSSAPAYALPGSNWPRK